MKTVLRYSWRTLDRSSHLWFETDFCVDSEGNVFIPIDNDTGKYIDDFIVRPIEDGEKVFLYPVGSARISEMRYTERHDRDQSSRPDPLPPTFTRRDVP